MNAIILCGGLSTRLGDITKDVPKILLEIGHESILDLQLDKLSRVRVKRVVLAAGHLASVLRKNVGTQRNGIELVYAIEDKKLGTGGAIKHGYDYLEDPTQPTWVLNGDILYTIDFSDMASQLVNKSDGIILGAKVEDAASYGTLEINDRKELLFFQEKAGRHEPGYINGGLYLFTNQVLASFPDRDSFSIEYDVFPHMKSLSVYTSDLPWIDVGVPERLEWARANQQLFV